MAQALALNLHPLGEETGNGQQAEPVDLLAYEGTGLLRQLVKLQLRAAAITSGALTAIIETSSDSSNPALWRTLWSGPVTLAGVELTKVAPELQRYIRVRWTVTGATAVTWELVGEAHVIYCLPGDITRYAVPERALQAIPVEDRADVCLEATSQGDGHIGNSHVLPLRKWSEAVRSHCARIAAATLFARRGADPNGPDATVFLGRDSAVSWFKRLADGRVSDPDIVDSTPESFEGGSVVASRPSRGWNAR